MSLKNNQANQRMTWLFHTSNERSVHFSTIKKTFFKLWLYTLLTHLDCTSTSSSTRQCGGRKSAAHKHKFTNNFIVAMRGMAISNLLP